MLKIYDKAQWHIDSGEDSNVVLAKLRAVFDFLNSKNLLSDEGKEIFLLGIDSSASLHERMVTENGRRFLDVSYDNVINYNVEDIKDALEREFKAFLEV